MGFAREIEVARTAANRAGELALRYQSADLQAEDKPDLSPVTIADRESEKLISGILDQEFPDDGLLGEEGVAKPSKSGRRWIIDPVDGTRDFLRGSPLWAVLIGLEAGDDVVAGVAYLPALGQLYHASRGEGAWRNGSPIHVSTIQSASRAVACVNSLQNIYKQPFAPRLLDWMGGMWSVRSLGGAPDAMLVASGQADVWIEPTAAAWDLAPIKIIVEEAGGRFFNFNGGNSIHGGNCVACTPALEGEARRLISGL